MPVSTAGCDVPIGIGVLSRQEGGVVMWKMAVYREERDLVKHEISAIKRDLETVLLHIPAMTPGEISELRLAHRSIDRALMNWEGCDDVVYGLRKTQ